MRIGKEGSEVGRRLSLISRSVNNKNIDITRPYIKTVARSVHFAFKINSPGAVRTYPEKRVNSAE